MLAELGIRSSLTESFIFLMSFQSQETRTLADEPRAEESALWEPTAEQESVGRDLQLKTKIYHVSFIARTISAAVRDSGTDYSGLSTTDTLPVGEARP